MTAAEPPSPTASAEPLGVTDETVDQPDTSDTDPNADPNAAFRKHVQSVLAKAADRGEKEEDLLERYLEAAKSKAAPAPAKTTKKKTSQGDGDQQWSGADGMWMPMQHGGMDQQQYMIVPAWPGHYLVPIGPDGVPQMHAAIPQGDVSGFAPPGYYPQAQPPPPKAPRPPAGRRPGDGLAAPRLRALHTAEELSAYKQLQRGKGAVDPDAHPQGLTPSVTSAIRDGLVPTLGQQLPRGTERMRALCAELRPSKDVETRRLELASQVMMSLKVLEEVREVNLIGSLSRGTELGMAGESDVDLAVHWQDPLVADTSHENWDRFQGAVTMLREALCDQFKIDEIDFRNKAKSSTVPEPCPGLVAVLRGHALHIPDHSFQIFFNPPFKGNETDVPSASQLLRPLEESGYPLPLVMRDGVRLLKWWAQQVSVLCEILRPRSYTLELISLWVSYGSSAPEKPMSKFPASAMEVFLRCLEFIKDYPKLKITWVPERMLTVEQRVMYDAVRMARKDQKSPHSAIILDAMNLLNNVATTIPAKVWKLLQQAATITLEAYKQQQN